MTWRVGLSVWDNAMNIPLAQWYPLAYSKKRLIDIFPSRYYLLWWRRLWLNCFCPRIPGSPGNALSRVPCYLFRAQATHYFAWLWSGEEDPQYETRSTDRLGLSSPFEQGDWPIHALWLMWFCEYRFADRLEISMCDMSGFVATIAELGVDRRLTEVVNRDLFCRFIRVISGNEKHML